MHPQLPARDADLIQIVDANLEDANRRGGVHIACRPGCTPCCHGVFRISALDAARLQAGLAALRQSDPVRAAKVEQRAHLSVQQLAPLFPGNPATGFLLPDEESDEPQEPDMPEALEAAQGPQQSAWDTFADLPAADRPCPALEPDTGTCALYSARPMTCRVFGPPVETEDGIGVCELCYTGASQQEIMDGRMRIDHQALEAELDHQLANAGHSEQTIVAWALHTMRTQP
jgi:Fe-S-cluster containining protein